MKHQLYTVRLSTEMVVVATDPADANRQANFAFIDSRPIVDASLAEPLRRLPDGWSLGDVPHGYRDPMDPDRPLALWIERGALPAPEGWVWARRSDCHLHAWAADAVSGDGMIVLSDAGIAQGFGSARDLLGYEDVVEALRLRNGLRRGCSSPPITSITGARPAVADALEWMGRALAEAVESRVAIDHAVRDCFAQRDAMRAELERVRAGGGATVCHDQCLDERQVDRITVGSARGFAGDGCA
jgi:hypothetical protein